MVGHKLYGYGFLILITIILVTSSAFQIISHDKVYLVVSFDDLDESTPHVVIFTVYMSVNDSWHIMERICVTKPGEYCSFFMYSFGTLIRISINTDNKYMIPFERLSTCIIYSDFNSQLTGKYYIAGTTIYT